MKLNFIICSVLSLSSWWQQPLGQSYGLRCQNGAMVSDLFAFRKTRSCTYSLSVEVDVGDLSTFVIE